MTISVSEPVCQPYRDEIKRLTAVLLDIASSMERPFLDPAEHANWCVERANDAVKGD